ncbi:MAG: sodium:proline symporter [Betaproteobacteria bacterium HGW-Betaproteobacteria-10]|nr:MAG: sodium:proline symporter [Betaproteobacteria bacterium HGW-Betaproteobacteria-10]
MRRLLFLLHRWLGISLCLFMALWFISGVVMLYVGYPKLSTAERLQSLPPLVGELCCRSPAEAIAALPDDFALRALRLTSIAGKPYYIAAAHKNRFAAVDAENGQILSPVDNTMALASVRAFAPTATLLGSEKLDEDAWTHSRAMDGHRPLFRVEIGDNELKYLYVSSTTGEVVRDVSLTESRWNWLGAWLHWLYPLRGSWLDPWWTEIVIYTSLAASGLALSGLFIGILRWRKKPYPNGACSPYRSVLMRWHHWLGLGFGLLALSWIASGLFSMNPWKIFTANAIQPLEQKWPARSEIPDQAVAQILDCYRRQGFEASELAWRPFGKTLLIEGKNAAGSLLLRAGEGCQPFAVLPVDELQQQGIAAMPGARLIETRLQHAYDWHYYARAPHSMGGHVEKPLPVLVLGFDDPARTTLYLDPRSGRTVQRLDGHLRVKRWLFALFHSWDWLPLLDRRPLWDGALIFASLGGLAISLSGVVLGWRRLRRR